MNSINSNCCNGAPQLQQRCYPAGQMDHASEKLATQKEELTSISEKFRFEFRNLAQGILEEKTARFTQ